MRPWISLVLPAPSMIVVLSLSTTTFLARPRSSSLRFSSLILPKRIRAAPSSFREPASLCEPWCGCLLLAGVASRGQELVLDVVGVGSFLGSRSRLTTYITYVRYMSNIKSSHRRRRAAGPARPGGVMFSNETKVLLVVSQDMLDRARVFAGTATATLKLPVSLQIVLRALIGEGLKRRGARALLANIESQAKAVRQIRSAARQKQTERGGTRKSRRNVPAG